jgi:hypothetical protein
MYRAGFADRAGSDCRQRGKVRYLAILGGRIAKMEDLFEFSVELELRKRWPACCGTFKRSNVSAFKQSLDLFALELAPPMFSSKPMPCTDRPCKFLKVSTHISASGIKVSD